MNLFKLSDIIVKHLKGYSSSREEKILRIWEDENVDNKEFLNNVREFDSLTDELKRYNKFDSKQAWKKFETNNNIMSRQIRPNYLYLRVAAIALLTLSVGSAIFLMNNKSRIVMVGKHHNALAPGTSNAILTIDEQGVLVLADSVSDSIVDNEKVLATIDKGQIQYGDSTVKPMKMSVEVPLKSEYQFVLSDSTKVWMNAGSKVSFEYPFNGNIRQVYVEGEVYFEVMKDIKRPFIVNLPSSNKIKVLGTSFNVNAYPGNLVQNTVLVEGSILWQTKEGKERMLEPGQLLSMDNENLSVSNIDVYPHIAWKDGRFVYEGETLEKIMQSLSRWYGVEVTYEQEVIKDLHFSMDVKRYSDLNDILSMLQLTEKVYFKINGSEILVSKHK